MRSRRLKVKGDTAFYHCISKTVNGERLFDSRDKEVFRKQMHQVAMFCGVEILTHCVLDNHFHILVRVPQPSDVSDDDLEYRMEVLYGPLARQWLRNALEDSTQAALVRTRLQARMGDLSLFMKELKQRFSIYYNRTHDRFGPLWCDRFKSLLVQGDKRTLATIAAYIDLNPVRAGLAKDPKDYRFCGYAEAVAGWQTARLGLRRVFGDDHWSRVARSYRLILFGKGHLADAGRQAGSISREQLDEVVRAGGRLGLTEILRCRIRFFSDGLAVGSREFLNGLKVGTGRKDRTPRPIPGADWGGLQVLRRLRGSGFG